MTTPLLTYMASGPGVHVDLDRLVASRMLVQANSGGGKSRAIRQLLEETYGRVQHLVIDPEGEFSTLREQFDYILAAKQGGDTIASPKYAKRLCRSLVEMTASAVLDLYDLTLDERREFVRHFLTELMALPRALWHPIIVVIDEMHVFAPEAGQAQSAEAVTSLATQGRKRGFCLVGATQRISKLHKDVAAELLNKMIGRTGLDIDVKRAGDELGMGKDDRTQLKTLAPGEFFVYGPAISNEVAKVKTGEVVTSHPEAGRIGTVPPPPSAKVRAMLARLADLPKEAEEEARALEDFKRQVATLRTQLTKAQKSGTVVDKPVTVTVVDHHAIDRAVAAAVKPYDARLATIKRTVSRVATVGQQLAEALNGLAAINFDPETVAHTNGNGNGHGTEVVPKVDQPSQMPWRNRTPAPARTVTPRASSRTSAGDSSLGKGERIVLTAIAQYPDGADREQLTFLTGYKRSSRDTYIQRLRQAGLVEINGSAIVATDAGVDSLGADFEPLPTGEALREYWLDRLTGGERAILGLLIDAEGESVPRDALTESTGYKRSSRDTYIQRLAARKLVVAVGRGEVKASATLFDEARR